MIDYWSVSTSIIIILGVILYRSQPLKQKKTYRDLFIPVTIIQNYLLPFLLPTDRLYINKATNIDATIALRRAFVLTHFPQPILKTLGGIDQCVNNYGFIKGTRDMVGGTDYIDCVCVEDLPNTDFSVYLGIDCFYRPFAIMRYWVHQIDQNDSETEQSETEQKEPTITTSKPVKQPKQVVVTMFQRYTETSSYLQAALASNSMTTWCFGTCYNFGCMPGDTCVNNTALEKSSTIITRSTGNIRRLEFIYITSIRSY